jgi:tetratricopeptide (TPR) repeat protein
MVRPPSARTRRELSISEAFAVAAGLLSDRRLDEAEKFFRALLREQPDHPRALHGLGVICRQTARIDEALFHLERSVAINADDAMVHNDLGIVLAGLGRLEAAVNHFEQVIVAAPDFGEAYYNLGIVLLELERVDQAIVRFEQALMLKPDRAELYGQLGKALALANRYAAAIDHYQKALELSPELAHAANHCGVALTLLERDSEALAYFERALASEPGDLDARVNLASTLARLSRHEEAIEHFQAVLAIKPDAAVECAFGTSLAALGRHGDAVLRYARALQLCPQFGGALNNLGVSLAKLDRHEEAVAAYRKALTITPGLVDVHSNLGRSLEELGREEEAVVSYDTMLAVDPENPKAHYQRGTALRTLGRLAEAQSEFERAVALAPARGEFYFGLAEGKRFAIGDPHLDAMEWLARQATPQPRTAQIGLHFALAKAYQDIQRYDMAFQHMKEGNALRRQRIRYDEAQTLGLFRRIAAVFTEDLISDRAGAGNRSKLPIFIVGMARSGSTLVEQILASHRDVHALGETVAYDRAIEELCARSAVRSGFPEAVLAATPEQFQQLAARYIDLVSENAPAVARITDKALGNFRCAGLIYLALPNARIIHTRRDPIDTCLSAFSLSMTKEQAHTFDLRELGRFYRGYEALMTHWRRVLPEGAMLDVQYEALVTDFEPQARRIVEYCGLEWDARCLKFYQTDRPVRTASASQVRQPMYQSAIGRWKPYKQWLGPLIEALGLPE